MASWRVDKESGGKLKYLNLGHGLDSKLGETTKSYHPASFTLLMRSLRSHYRRSVKTQKIRFKMFTCNTLNYSPQRLLRSLLQKTINTIKNSTKKIFVTRGQQSFLQDQQFVVQDGLFPIKRIRNAYPVRYISPIAHRLAANSIQPAFEIAEELVTQLLYQCQSLKRSSDSSLLIDVLQGLTIQATSQGYMQFDFSDGAIVNYLNHLLHFLPKNPESPCSRPKLPLATALLHHRIFLLQHTHARCCSLLRLAHEHHFIQLNSAALENQSNYWQIAAPTALSWLTETQQFRTNHTTELHLIGQIVTVLDTLPNGCTDPLNSSTLPESSSKGAMTLLTLAEGLSQAFYESHQCWQLMGNLRTQGRDRLQAHLGLILITQRLLYQLLHDQLGMEVPFQL